MSLNIVGQSYYGIPCGYRRDRTLCYENSNIKERADYYAREMKSKCDPSKIKYVGVLPREQYLRNKHIIDRNLPPNKESGSWWLEERFYPQTNDEAFQCRGHECAYAVVTTTDGEPHLSYDRVDQHLGIRLYGVFSGNICI